MNSIASQVTSLTIVYSIVHSGADQRKYQSSASLAFAATGEFPAQNDAENVSIWWRHDPRKTCIKLWDVITHLCPNFNDDLAKPTWMSNYTSRKTVAVITYPCHNTPDPSNHIQIRGCRTSYRSGGKCNPKTSERSGGLFEKASRWQTALFTDRCLVTGKCFVWVYNTSQELCTWFALCCVCCVLAPLSFIYHECCARSRYQGQGQGITSHRYTPHISSSGTSRALTPVLLEQHWLIKAKKSHWFPTKWLYILNETKQIKLCCRYCMGHSVYSLSPLPDLLWW